MNGIKKNLLLAVAGLGLIACSSGSDSGGSPVNADLGAEVSKTLDPQVNGSGFARKISGDLPDATADEQTLSVGLSGSSEDEVSNGDFVDKDLTVESDDAVESILLKVLGSNDYFEFLIPADAKSSRAFNVRLPIPANYTSGRFCVVFAARTVSQQVSPTSRQQCVQVASSLGAAATPAPSASATPAPTMSSAPSAMPTVAPTSDPSSPPASSAPTATPSATPAPTASATPMPTATPAATGSAAACFNPDLFVQGTRVVQTYKSTNSDGTVDFTDDRTVTGPATFNGQQTIETTGTTTSTVSGSGTSTTQTETYSKVNNNVPQIETVGTTSSSSTQFGTVENENVLTPPRVDRYDLNPGESQSQSYVTASTSSSFGQTINSETATDSTRTYVGRVAVSVPAGTYDTCQFDESETSTTTVSGQSSTSSSTTSNYFDVDSGLLVKSLSGDTTTELIEATINGVAVR